MIRHDIVAKWCLSSGEVKISILLATIIAGTDTVISILFIIKLKNLLLNLRRKGLTLHSSATSSYDFGVTKCVPNKIKETCLNFCFKLMSLNLNSNGDFPHETIG